MAYTYTPIKNETVVVLDENGRVVGTIKRYRTYKTVIVAVPGVMSDATHRGARTFRTIAQAKKALDALAV